MCEQEWWGGPTGGWTVGGDGGVGGSEGGLSANGRAGGGEVRTETGSGHARPTFTLGEMAGCSPGDRWGRCKQCNGKTGGGGGPGCILQGTGWNCSGLGERVEPSLDEAKITPQLLR